MPYNYKIPNEETLKEALLVAFDSFPTERNEWAHDILSKGYIELEGTQDKVDDNGHFLMKVKVRALTNTLRKYDADEQEEIAGAFIDEINEMLPNECGYRVKFVYFVPRLEDGMKDSKDVILGSIESERMSVLARDLLDKGKRMSEAYVILYCLENLLRDFIDKTLIKKIGKDYEEKILIPNDVRINIQNRKNDEAKNLWLPSRGDKLVFYLDFKDLDIIIENNWKEFKSSLPDTVWIKSKIQELYRIRNLIAHNTGYINDSTFNILNIYYDMIVKQIGKSPIF